MCKWNTWDTLAPNSTLLRRDEKTSTIFYNKKYKQKYKDKYEEEEEYKQKYEEECKKTEL